jgi:hypothetical protein
MCSPTTVNSLVRGSCWPQCLDRIYLNGYVPTLQVGGQVVQFPHFGWDRAERRVTCYYFYVWDEEFGPAFIKICAYFPYPIKVWLNGHEWTKRQASKAGIGWSALGNACCCDDSRTKCHPSTSRIDYRYSLNTAGSSRQSMRRSSAYARIL